MNNTKTILSVLLALVVIAGYTWVTILLDKRDDLYNHTLGYQEGTCDSYTKMLTGPHQSVECIKDPVLWTGSGYSANISFDLRSK